MSFQEFPPALMVLSPRLTKAGDPGSSVVGINTTPLADGAILYCIENQAGYRLDKQSSAAPDGNLVLAPLVGPGRWLMVSVGPEGPTGPGGPPGEDGPTGPGADSTGSTPTTDNKNMAAADTVIDGDLACPTAVASPPADSAANGGYIGVSLNGVMISDVGDGVTTTSCYFSGDGGITARALRDVITGDFLYWNESIAGVNLSAATDILSFYFNVQT